MVEKARMENRTRGVGMKIGGLSNKELDGVESGERVIVLCNLSGLKRICEFLHYVLAEIEISKISEEYNDEEWRNQRHLHLKHYIKTNDDDNSDIEIYPFY